MFLFLKKSDPNLFSSSTSSLMSSESSRKASVSPKLDCISSELTKSVELDIGSFLFHKSLSFLISCAFPPIRISCFSASTSDSPWSLDFCIKTISSESVLYEAFFLNSFISWPYELKLTNSIIIKTSLLNIDVKFNANIIFF